jgi:hypothetical protein
VTSLLARRYVRAIRAGVRPDPPTVGRRDLSAGRSRSSAALENRRCPPGVVNTRRRPASLQRLSVAGETPRSRLASERPTQSALGDVGRATKPTQIYQNVCDSLNVPRLAARREYAENRSRHIDVSLIEGALRVGARLGGQRWFDVDPLLLGRYPSCCRSP